MMQRRLSLSALLLLGALPLAALALQYAQAPPTEAPAQEPTPLFDQLDVNSDGFVTQEEAKRSAEVTARFKELDINRDAKVSADEFKKGMQVKM